MHRACRKTHALRVANYEWTTVPAPCTTEEEEKQEGKKKEKSEPTD